MCSLVLVSLFHSCIQWDGWKMSLRRWTEKQSRGQRAEAVTPAHRWSELCDGTWTFRCVTYAPNPMTSPWLLQWLEKSIQQLHMFAGFHAQPKIYEWGCNGKHENMSVNKRTHIPHLLLYFPSPLTCKEDSCIPNIQCDSSGSCPQVRCVLAESSSPSL